MTRGGVRVSKPILSLSHEITHWREVIQVLTAQLLRTTIILIVVIVLLLFWLVKIVKHLIQAKLAIGLRSLREKPETLMRNTHTCSAVHAHGTNAAHSSIPSSAYISLYLLVKINPGELFIEAFICSRWYYPIGRHSLVSACANCSGVITETHIYLVVVVIIIVNMILLVSLHPLKLAALYHAPSFTAECLIGHMFSKGLILRGVRYLEVRCRRGRRRTLVITLEPKLLS